jgi:hypothetical protein
MLKIKRPILSRKKTQPIVYRPWKSHGTVKVVSALSLTGSFGRTGEMLATYSDISRLQYLQWPSGHNRQQVSRRSDSTSSSTYRHSKPRPSKMLYPLTKMHM